jgi:hypothetical protein
MDFFILLDPIKKITGVMFPILMFFIVGIVILTLSRLFLCLWQKERVSNAHGWKIIFSSGLRMDCRISYLSKRSHEHDVEWV